MTTPTAFALSANIAVCDTLTFAAGVSITPPQAAQTAENLLNLPTKGYTLPNGVIGYLLGAYEPMTGIFTVGFGTQTLFWSGTAEEFSYVGQNGGNWQLAA